MFTITDNDYVAAAFALPVAHLAERGSVMAAAFFAEARKHWRIEGRLLVENSPQPFDRHDRRYWFSTAMTSSKEDEAVDELRRLWKEFQRANGWGDKRLKKHHGFRLVRGNGPTALLRTLNTIPGFRLNAMPTMPCGEVTSYGQGELPTGESEEP
jgi:hypothetical protein